MARKDYPGVKVDVRELKKELHRFFATKGCEVQMWDESSSIASSTILEVRKTNKFRELTGSAYALKVVITLEGNDTWVEIVEGKWPERVAAGLASIVINPALVAVPALFAHFQHQLAEETWKLIQRHIAHVDVPESCPHCHEPISGDFKFCPHCAGSLAAETTCQSCGAVPKNPTAPFCDQCGNRL